ncbi:hypothetical protein GYB22_06540 [bacterium]|nr:hypothetical protein [bacterium]
MNLTSVLISLICLIGFPSFQTDHHEFELTYNFAGLGSNMNTMQPVFRVRGTNCIYTYEENSTWTGEFTKEPDTLYVGSFRASSIDSITALISGIQDTLIYKANIHISSGGIHFLNIKTNTQKLEYNLQNTSDSTAEKIIAVLNSNIPSNFEKLHLFKE